MSGSPHRFRVSRLGSCWYLLCDYTKQNNWATMDNVAVRAECRDIAPVICYSYTLVAVNWMTYKILLLAHCREILFAILCRVFSCNNRSKVIPSNAADHHVDRSDQKSQHWNTVSLTSMRSISVNVFIGTRFLSQASMSRRGRHVTDASANGRMVMWPNKN